MYFGTSFFKIRISKFEKMMELKIKFWNFIFYSFEMRIPTLEKILKPKINVLRNFIFRIFKFFENLEINVSILEFYFSKQESISNSQVLENFFNLK